MQSEVCQEEYNDAEAIVEKGTSGSPVQGAVLA